MLKETIMSSFKNKLAGAVLKKDLETFAKKMDYSEYGGSVLLGLDGTVVKLMVVQTLKHFILQLNKQKLLVKRISFKL